MELLLSAIQFYLQDHHPGWQVENQIFRGIIAKYKGTLVQHEISVYEDPPNLYVHTYRNKLQFASISASYHHNTILQQLTEIIVELEG